jgi:hypothetical protein
MKFINEKDEFFDVEGPFKVLDEKVAYYLVENEDTREKTLVDVKSFIVNTAGESPKWKVLEESEYGGHIIDLQLLDVGTEFYVHNGVWSGRITECEGVKGIVMKGDCAFYPLSKVAGSDELAISIIRK